MSVPVLEVEPVEPLYGATQGWNSRVVSTGPLATQGTDTACEATVDTSTQDASFADCIHGGAVRSVSVNRDDCTDVTATDSLGAFTWSCVDSGEVRVISTGFAPGKSLRDLIDFETGAFLENSVTVDDGSESASTSASVWWNNPVILADETTSLDTSGAVYVYAADPKSAVVVETSDVTVVTAPGVAITTSGVNNTVQLNLFSYFTGNVVSSASNYGILASWPRPIVHDTSVTFVPDGGADSGVLLASGCFSAVLDQVQVRMLDGVDGDPVTEGDTVQYNSGGGSSETSTFWGATGGSRPATHRAAS